jgi:hypothetical protein
MIRYASMSSAVQSLFTAVQNANPDPNQAIPSLAPLQLDGAADMRNVPLTDANAGLTAMLRRSTVVALSNSTNPLCTDLLP